MSKNDERIMLLKKDIEMKRKELADKNNRFVPVTNCLLVLDKVTYNLHVDSSELLLIRLNMMAMSAKDLGMDISKIVISGFSLEEWIVDIKNCIEVQKYKKKKKKLDSLEKELTALLSDDKQTELQIDALAAMLDD